MQLALFVPTQEIIDAWDKIDSNHCGRWDDNYRTPREQWYEPEEPGEFWNEEGCSTGEYKRSEIRDSFVTALLRGILPPVACYLGGRAGLTLADGHHRLAAAEQYGVPYLAVTYRDVAEWGSMYDSEGNWI